MSILIILNFRKSPWKEIKLYIKFGIILNSRIKMHYNADVVSILNKKSQDFQKKNLNAEKKKDGSLVSKYKTFKMIDASFIVYTNNNNFKFMSACDNQQSWLWMQMQMFGYLLKTIKLQKRYV